MTSVNTFFINVLFQVFICGVIGNFNGTASNDMNQANIVPSLVPISKSERYFHLAPLLIIKQYGSTVLAGTGAIVASAYL